MWTLSIFISVVDVLTRLSTYFLALTVLGVADDASAADGPLEQMRVRSQATCWNMARTFRPTDPTVDGMTLATLAGAKKSDLRHWMETCPAPTPAELRGTWRGLNRGIGPALLGFSQFSKQICTTCAGGHGDNISIHQRSPGEWHCASSWRMTLKNGQIDRSGNYAVVAPDGKGKSPQGIVFNYGAADNPMLDPSRNLVDKVVKLNDNFMLGRAMMKVGLVKITVAYFALERVDPTTAAIPPRR